LGTRRVVVGTVRDVAEREDDTVTFVMRITQTRVHGADGWQCLAGHAGPLSAEGSF
jgi:hypothetical protein